MGELSIFKRPGEEQLHVTSSNKYLFESYKSISEICRRQLGEIQIKGIQGSRNFVSSRIMDFPNETDENARKFIERKIDVVLKLIDEITINLETDRYDPISFKEMALEGGTTSEWAERLSKFFEIDSVEAPIADEISFLYYLNLNDEWYFHVMEEPLYEKDSEPLMRPILCLSEILEEDEELRKWFSSWINNLLKYQEEVLQTMRDFYNVIRIQS